MTKNLITIVCFFSLLLSDGKDNDFSEFVEHPENGHLVFEWKKILK